MAGTGLLLRLSSLRISQPATNAVSLHGAVVRCLAIRTADLGFPMPPKQPKSAFLHFLHLKTPSIRSANPDIKLVQATKLIGDMWRDLPQNEKQEYLTRSRAEFEQYNLKKQLYMASLSKGQKMELEEYKQQLKEQRAKKRATQKKKAMKALLQKPHKGSACGFSLFQVEASFKRGNLPFNEYMEKMAKQWSELPQEERKEYTRRAHANNEQYKKDMLIWEQFMIEKGHQDMIRKTSLILMEKAQSKSKSETSLGERSKKVLTQVDHD